MPRKKVQKYPDWCLNTSDNRLLINYLKEPIPIWVPEIVKENISDIAHMLFTREMIPFIYDEQMADFWNDPDIKQLAPDDLLYLIRLTLDSFNEYSDMSASEGLRNYVNPLIKYSEKLLKETDSAFFEQLTYYDNRLKKIIPLLTRTLELAREEKKHIAESTGKRDKPLSRKSIVIVEIVNNFKDLLGKKHYRLAALVASVAFEDVEITEQEVRHIYRRCSIHKEFELQGWNYVSIF